jgi:hypothetical protein
MGGIPGSFIPPHVSTGEKEILRKVAWNYLNSDIVEKLLLIPDIL